MDLDEIRDLIRKGQYEVSFHAQQERLGSVPRGGKREPFSIVFRGPHDSPIGQGTYKIGHDKMGAFDLFLVPIAPDKDGRYYEAVFT